VADETNTAGATDPVALARFRRAQSRRVMLATPCARAPVLEYTTAFADTCVNLTVAGIKYETHFVIGSSNLPNARNTIVARFLASQCTDLILIDDDMGWRPEAIIRLLASEQKVIGGVGRKKVEKPNSDPEVWCFSALTDENKTIPPQDAMGAVQVKAVGTAFLKIERSVFEDMIAAHPEWKRTGPHSMSDEVKAHYYKFFRFDLDDDDEDEMGEDFVFCHRWRELGGTVWIDPQIGLVHVGFKAWAGCIADHLMVKAPDRLESAA
jgi:hypothetical protein